jgi:membrane associated rhomboid family serine protease
MFILPLHKPLSLGTLPVATLLLILINALVYFFYQLPAQSKLDIAKAFYQDSSLPEIELPAYRQQTHSTEIARHLEELEELSNAEQASILFELMQFDAGFQAVIAKGLVPQVDPKYAAYASARREFTLLMHGADFTIAHSQKSGEFVFKDMFTACFLHASFEHLFGNMLMLLLVGLLVEGALSRWYLPVYLLAGLGGGLLSAWLRLHATGYGLGASGAIAGLMGALPVLWGLRKVKVFYWILFYFDYGRITAIWLLPLWLGKELYSLAFVQSGVGFDAHAGGMITGAALSAILVYLGQRRAAFFEDDNATEAGESAPNRAALSQGNTAVEQFQLGMQAMGRLDFRTAHRHLEIAANALPADLEILQAAYRAAKFGPGGAVAGAAAERLLSLPSAPIAETYAVYLDCKDTLPLSTSAKIKFAQRLLQARAENAAYLDTAGQALVTIAKTAPLSVGLIAAMQTLQQALQASADPRAEQIKAWLAKRSQH